MTHAGARHPRAVSREASRVVPTAKAERDRSFRYGGLCPGRAVKGERLSCGQPTYLSAASS